MTCSRSQSKTTIKLDLHPDLNTPRAIVPENRAGPRVLNTSSAVVSRIGGAEDTLLVWRGETQPDGGDRNLYSGALPL